MKGQGKRFVNHKGKAYNVFNFHKRKDNVEKEESVGFFDLWRYAENIERAATCLAVLLAWCSSCGLIAAIVIYGELTSLLVQRHKGEGDANKVYILTLFGGGEILPDGASRNATMDALVSDSVAFGLASIAIMCLQLVCAATAVTLANWSGQRMISRLRCKLLESILKQEIAFFDTNSNMNFATILTDDMEKILGGVGEHVPMIAYLAGSVAAAGGVGLAYGWRLTLAGLALIPVAVLVAATVTKYQTRYSEREARAYSAAGSLVQGALAAVRTVRAFAGERVETDKYLEALKPAARASEKRGLCAAVGSGIGWLLTYALNAIVLAYGAQLCVRDMHLPPEEVEYTPGVMLTILFCTFMSAQNVAMCHPHLELFSSARGAAAAVYRLLERRSKIDASVDEGVKPEEFAGDIAFENVYFNYPSRPDVKVLRGLTLTIKAGETVALVGGSGCGKSTVLQLLQRLYDPESGTITVDGKSLQALNLHHYRTKIGVVGQEPVLFSGSVFENISLGQNLSEEEVILAAKAAHAHQFISKLADGYKSPVGGGNGAQLSGGQKQRIALARGLVRRPKILLLDEPTSALDPASERQVQAALDAASVGRTTIVVSHRLSTIVNATKIVYIEQGAVLEQGSYHELLEKRGAFYQLVQADLSSKSVIAAPLSAAEEEDDNVVMPAAGHFQRALSSQSFVRSSACRGSARLGSVSSAHVPLAGSPHLLYQATEVDEDLDSPDVAPASAWQLLKLNAPERWLLVAGGLAAFFLGATMPLFALLFSSIYGMFASSDPTQILSQSQVYAGLFLVVASACGLATFLQGWLLHRAGARMTDRLRHQAFAAFLRQEQAWLDDTSNSVGALCARLAGDCAAVQGATGIRLGSILQGVSTMLLGVALAMFYSWKMTLVSLLSVPCVMGGIYLEGRVMQRTDGARRRELEQASRLATEAVINIRTVHTLGVEVALHRRYTAALSDCAGAGGRMVRGAVYGACLCAPTLGYAVSLAYGGYLVARDNMPYEYAILVSEALIYGAWMLAEALSFAPNMAAARRSGARIIQILQRRPTIVDPEIEDDDDWSATGEISLKDVTFTYPRRRTPVLRGVTLRVPAGRSVALVGPSGCGKSTVMQLLLRLYDPATGTVELDSRDIKTNLTQFRLRRQLGLVQQEPSLFDRSIRENIAYGDNTRDVPIEEIIEAAKKANVHSFIASLPMGYETQLGVGGASLSGGQKQRVAIARALLRDPTVLLLDEATSALDAASEKVVQAALEEASQGRTTIVIAHRLATVRHCDTICLIDKGVIAEQGTHEELVKKRGLYYEMLQQQEQAS